MNTAPDPGHIVDPLETILTATGKLDTKEATNWFEVTGFVITHASLEVIIQVTISPLFNEMSAYELVSVPTSTPFTCH